MPQRPSRAVRAAVALTALCVSPSSPNGAWARAGLATSDELISMNGQPAASTAELRAAVGAATVGDVVHVGFLCGAGRRSVPVAFGPYEEVSVALADVGQRSGEQRVMRRYWMQGPEGVLDDRR